ncbi:MAG: hypothetical protein PHP52_04230 [Bacteroidales bacterium]|nr:hypothetical protein [Bacteroidales bacterium]MDD4217362.1 hypothetical protein [Bacteroidales bacterium]
MKIASIDIGTNTCNLLIAEHSNTTDICFIHREKQPISLINKDDKQNNIIPEKTIENLVNVLQNYRLTIQKLGVKTVIATATSGIRSAKNQQEILQTIKAKTEFEIEVIDGNREASLVFAGVKNAVHFTEKHNLIIDIGGGSIEFIIANSSDVKFTHSFQIGVARLLNRYKFSDPLSTNDISIINQILDENLSDMINLCQSLKIDTIIGSSGSYETFANLIKYEFNINLCEDAPYNVIDINYFEKTHEKLINYNFEQRKNMLGMEIIRVQLIPISSVITKYLLDKLNIKKFIQSNYSIKEGLIFDYLSKNY